MPRVYKRKTDKGKVPESVMRDALTAVEKGPSGVMEPGAAKVIWSRSLSLHNFRYTKMVGDGDSKTFQLLNSLKPYGQDVLIVKEECVNHVSKRLCTALRNVKDCSKLGDPIGGRKNGSLTDKKISQLGIYFGRAIRGHKTAEEMQKAAWASLYHNYSTDVNLQHQYCPPCKDS
nr:hypothetical protein BgiMline_021075 [Biomphalaria glabrata]